MKRASVVYIKCAVDVACLTMAVGVEFGQLFEISSEFVPFEVLDRYARVAGTLSGEHRRLLPRSLYMIRRFRLLAPRCLRR